ncbi:MAG: AI-2E family transporter [Thermoanaerobaculia bacterium]
MNGTNGSIGSNGELLLFAKKMLIFFGVAIAVVFLWEIRRILILLFIAGVLAAGISPAVHQVRVRTRHYLGKRIRRGTAVILVYVPFLVTAVLFAVFGLPVVLVEGRDLAVQLPALIDQHILTPLGRMLPVDEMRKMLSTEAQGIPVFGYLRSAVTLIASIVIVLALIVYIMIDAERLRNLFLLFYPAEERGKKRRTARRISRRMSSWLAGQLTLSLIVGLATLVVLTALRIPYAIPLAIVAAVGEMIPIVGPILSAVPALIVALFLSPWQFWSVLAAAILIQQVENYFLVPRIMSDKVSVSPLAVFVAFLVGGSMLGVVGAILAIPAAAIVQVAFEEGFLTQRERRRDRGRRGTLLTERRETRRDESDAR